ncbi:glycosyltransferase, partial [Escherichia coli]|nr:glycosyltransferase [Escherichia coli]
MSKLSVIMSVYSESEKMLRQSIDSVLNQSFRDFEFIIVNDNPERIEIIQLLR